uniref:Reverse transcriptase domain-containing protein n=1 Tax=Tanacetum cinerariifolium TaxID=118510 RepID=A0A6L2P3L1_TANCI|nr:hypothetical protein [Tanacetum cinerariifolium]
MNWYRNLRIVLRSEGKLAHLEQSLIPHPDPVASRAARDRALENYKAYDMIQELKTMFEEQAKHELFEIVKAFHACKQKEGQSDKKKPRGAKGKDKEKNKLAYAPNPKIPPPHKRDNPTKDSVYHHCKEVGHWRRNYPSYQAELKKRKNASVTSTSGIFTIELYDFPSKTWVYDTGCGTYICNTSQGLKRSRRLKHEALSLNKRAKHVLDSSYLWYCRLGHINKKCMDKLQRDGILQPTHDESLEKCKSCIFGKMARKPFPHQVERAKDLLGLTHTDGYALESVARILNMIPTKKALVKRNTPNKLDPRSIKCIFVAYLKETMGYYFYYPLDNKIFVARNAKFFENNLMVQEASRSHGLLKSSRSDKGLELIQEEDTQPYENTSEVHNEVAPIKEYELGDLNESPNYKATLSDPEFDKWLEAMNTEMQSMKDNQVWVLVDLRPNGRTVGSKWIFKKKTDMDGNVHTFKARLVAKRLYQTYGKDYGETFSLGYTSMIEKLDYRNSQGTKTPSEVQRMQRVPYASVIDKDNTKSQTGYVFVLNGKAVDLKSAKKSTTAMYSKEAEYIATAEASMEAILMRKFIDELRNVMPSNKRPMEMLCDNEPEITIANDLRILKGARHFQRKYHYICEVVKVMFILRLEMQAGFSWLHQGSTISPYLFALIIDKISKGIHEDIPWCLIFAKDIMLVSESAEGLNNKLKNWREALENNGLSVSREKTQYLRCDFGRVEIAKNKVVDIRIGEKILQLKESFRYLVLMIQKSGRIGKDKLHHFKAAWMKWMVAIRVLRHMKVPLKLKGKVYRVSIRPTMLYGTMLDMIPNGVYRSELEVKTIINKMRDGWLRPKLRWDDKVKHDMNELLLSKEMTCRGGRLRDVFFSPILLLVECL